MEFLASIPPLLYLIAAALAIAAFIHFVLPKLKASGASNAVTVGAADVHAVLSTIAGHLGTIVAKAADAPPPAATAAAPPSSAPADVVHTVSDLPPDQTTWILCPKTGHRLPPPIGDKNTNEGLLTYFVRTCPQTGGTPGAAGGLVLMQSALHTVNDGDPAKWPFIADEYANREAYLTDAEKTDAATAAARDQAAAARMLTGAFPVASYMGPETLPDRLYLFRTRTAYVQATSRDIYEDVFYGPWSDVRWVINDAGSTHVADPFDLASYSGPLRTWVERRMAGG